MADNEDARAQAKQRLQARRAAADTGPKGPFLREYAPTGGLPAVSAQKTSVVFYRNGGYSVVTALGVRHVDKPMLARPYTVCEIAVGTLVTPLRIELPAAGGTSFFKAEVDIEWEVTDPHMVAVQAVKDVATRLTAPILERLREVTLSYRVTDAEQANRTITRECAGGRWSDLGAELGLRVRLYVRLGVDDDAIAHAKKKREVAAEAEVTRQRQAEYRRMLQGGDLEQLSFMLAADPDGAKDFLEKIRQEGREDERERVDRLYAMAISGELSTVDVETQILNLLNPKGRRPLQGPIGSLPPRREPRQLEPAADGPFTPDWVSDEPPRRRSHRPGPDRADYDDPGTRTRRRNHRPDPYPADDRDDDDRRAPARGRAQRPGPSYPRDDAEYDEPRVTSRQRAYRPEPYPGADREDDAPRARTDRQAYRPEPYATGPDAGRDDPRTRDDRPRPYRSEPYHPDDDGDHDDPRARTDRQAYRPEPYTTGPDTGRDDPRTRDDRPRPYRSEPYHPDDDGDHDDPGSRARRRPARPELPSGPDPDDYDDPRARDDRSRTYRPEPYHPDDDLDRERPRRRRRAADDGWSWAEEDR
ncbi:hypothetical protein ACIBU0_05465 [Streptomyces sp. NPDC049627]|uniref:hypothetical protein n=1 Tax=Streptomyces sp. NPDC049627 TaxID=3365595 RepID=UPI00379996B9